MKNLIHLILAGIAGIVLLFGLLAMFSPLPGASLIVATGLVGLVLFSPRAKRGVRFLRTRWPHLNRGISWFESRVGSRIKFIGAVLSDTQPSIKK